MRVQFLRNTDVTEHGTGPAFVAGQVADLKPASATYWKGLGAAVDAPPELPEPQAASPAPEVSGASSETAEDSQEPQARSRRPRGNARDHGEQA